MNCELTLRKANIHDFTQVSAVFKAAIKEMNAKSIYQWDDLYPDDTILKEDISAGQMYLTEIEDKIVSIFVLNQEYDEPYNNANWKYKNSTFAVIHRLCVYPSYQNKGFGTVTVNLIEEMLRSKGIECIRLDAFSLNPSANKLYEKLGYKKVGEATYRKGLFYLYEKKL